MATLTLYVDLVVHGVCFGIGFAIAWHAIGWVVERFHRRRQRRGDVTRLRRAP